MSSPTRVLEVLLVVLVVLALQGTTLAFVCLPGAAAGTRRSTSSQLFMARSAKPLEKDDAMMTSAGGKGKGQGRGEGGEEEEMIVLPFDGLVGREKGLFRKELDALNPIQAAYDLLPGEDGSPERKAAIEAAVRQRIAAIQADNYKPMLVDDDPLKGVPLWKASLQMLAVCRPFESYSELALTFLLANLTTIVVGLYVTAVNTSFSSWMQWYIDSDISLPSFLRF